ncbi:hypothetical protein J3R83DRAFT_1523 [Lanmaoa asiatica]|nr:hypothetical protein J3R83DRAFT_1523 [Lanmaoa asiatica]
MTGNHSPPPYSLPFPAPPPYSPPCPAISPPIPSPSIWQRFRRFLGGIHDHGYDSKPKDPVPTPLHLSPVDTIEEPSFDIFQQIPTKTIVTSITAWGNLDLTSSPDVELKVTTLTHHKCLVSEYQHEFLLMEVQKRSTGTPYVSKLFLVLSDNSHKCYRLIFHVVVQRSFDEDDPGATKTSGPAYDTLLVLSKSDEPNYTSAAIVSTLSWAVYPPPPLNNAIKLLYLMSSNFPKYDISRHNCYHYAVVGSIVLATYRYGGRPRTPKGTMSSKRSRFLTMKILNADEVYNDAITVIVQYYHELLTGVTLGKGKGRAV